MVKRKRSGGAPSRRSVPVEEFLPDDQEKAIRKREAARKRDPGSPRVRPPAPEHLEILKRTASTNAEEADAILSRLDPKPFALQPLAFEWRHWLPGLNYRPSDLIRVCGSVALDHPFVVAAIRRLSRFARDPRDIRNPDPLLRVGKQAITDACETLPDDEAAIRARGLAAIERMPLEAGTFREGPEAHQTSVLRDETSPANHKARSDWAVEELKRIFRALADRSAYAGPESHRYLRTFREYERLRREGKPEKQAVAKIAREQRRGGNAVRGDIRRAREATGKRTRAYQERHRRPAGSGIKS